jgi:glycosyltransferase involved in cell wall biosynthesis
MTRRVAFVGPLPPPVHGFSNACAHVLDLLTARSAVKIFDRTPRGNNVVLKRVTQLLQPFRYIAWCRQGRDSSLYLALSGGHGQIFDWPYVMIAKILGSRIFIHHHSFSYLNSPNIVNRVFFAFVRNETHIVLSEGMGLRLSNTYKLDSNVVRVVSNAAFYAPKNPSARVEGNARSPICVGFLSNITFEKGFVEFFEVLSELKKRGVAYQAMIAGPVGPDASAKFYQLLSSSPDTVYFGPIYGDIKEGFYDQLDVFLFPTKYDNEAEPLVIHEALRSGVQVFACDRGAIAEMLSNGAGLVFTRDDFVQSAALHIERLSRNRTQLRIAQRLSQERFQRMRSVARTAISELLNEMTGISKAEKGNGP